jgi:GntR family transcriptional regulator
VPRSTVVSAAADAVPTALYVRIKEYLREAILRGDLKPHAQLPSESELIRQFGVSRITVRQALNDLQKENLIFKIHGKGSFVLNPKTDQHLSSLQGFAEALSPAGYEVLNQVVDCREVVAPRIVAEKLALAPGTPVIEIKRVRFLNRAPVSFEITYLPRDIGSKVAKADLATRDIFLIIENDLSVILGNADLTIEAALADAAVARYLRLKRGAPILRIERLTSSADRQPLDFEYLFYRGDAFRYRLNIGRIPARPAVNRRRVRTPFGAPNG